MWFGGIVFSNWRFAPRQVQISIMMLGSIEKWGIVLSNGFPEKIRFFDTTLRDGEQTPGVSLTPESKLRIAKCLDELGVDVIEAGFASVSEGEMEAVKLIAKEDLRAEICSCARGVKKDIEAVVKSGADSVHLVIPTSDMHLQYKLKKSREEILKITNECVRYAKDNGLTVELSAEDATRSDIDFVKNVFAVGVSAGADRNRFSSISPKTFCKRILVQFLPKPFQKIPG